MHRSKTCPYSMTSSARPSKAIGSVRPSALAQISARKSWLHCSPSAPRSQSSCVVDHGHEAEIHVQLLMAVE